MQFIENSLFGVRAAVYELARGADEPRFMLLPMIHIGAPSYYRDVRSKLVQCDAILFESVRSLRGSILTLSYRILVRRKRLGLVTQGSALPLRDLPVRLIHGDVTVDQFAESWGRVRWHWRAALYIGAPILGVFRYLTATRQSLGKHMATEDLPSKDDAMREEYMPDVTETILHERDRNVVDRIRNIVQDKLAGRSLTGIVYGAAHMGAITNALMGDLGYRVVKSEWLWVFSYEDV
jgi:hypothetical protein